MRPQLTCMCSIRNGACRTFRQVEHSEKYINVCSSDVIPTTASTTTALYNIAYYIITNSTMSSNSSLSSTRSPGSHLIGSDRPHCCLLQPTSAPSPAHTQVHLRPHAPVCLGFPVSTPDLAAGLAQRHRSAMSVELQPPHSRCTLHLAQRHRGAMSVELQPPSATAKTRNPRRCPKLDHRPEVVGPLTTDVEEEGSSTITYTSP